MSVRRHVKSHESVVIRCWRRDSGGAADVDCREPCLLRPQQPALSQRPDRRRVGADRASDPAREAWRQQAHGQHARSGQRPDVCPEHGLPVAGPAQRPAAAQHGARLLRPLELGRHPGTHPPCAVCEVPRTRRAGRQPDGWHHRQPKREERRKGGRGLDPAASTRARRSKARSATSLSTRKAC